MANNDGRIFVADSHCNDRVAMFGAEGEYLGDYRVAGMTAPHSVLLDECADALLVADQGSAMVHQFDVTSREHKGVRQRILLSLRYDFSELFS